MLPVTLPAFGSENISCHCPAHTHGNVPVREDTLATISQLARRLVALQAEAARQTTALNELNAAVRELSEKQLPDLMSSVGLRQIQTQAGNTLMMRTDYFASIPKARSEEAFAWLRTRNMDGIIREELSVRPEHRQQLIAAGVDFHVEASIHPSTLKALVREQIEAGNEFPRELFGVYVAEKVVVK